YGRLRKARQIRQAAETAARRDGAKEPAAFLETLQAIQEAMQGNAAQAKQRAHGALLIAQDYNTRLNAAIALALSNDSSGALRLLDAVNKERPVDTLIQNSWLPAIRAQIELNNDHAQHALELVESAKPYELTSGIDMPMYPVYVRGSAYLALGDGTA